VARQKDEPMTIIAVMLIASFALGGLCGVLVCQKKPKEINPSDEEAVESLILDSERHFLG